MEGAGRLLLAEAVSSAIERRFLATGHPRGLTLLQPCGFGDDGDAGASHFAHEGLVRRVISPGYGDSPRMAALALANKVEAYCFPQGVVCQMVWAAASRKPRILSHVGLDTFVDPSQGGGRLNDVTTAPMVERVRDRRERLALVHGGADRRGDHPRHDRRRVREHEHGARAGDPGAA